MTACRWNGRENPRTVTGRHDDGCRDDQCRGCQPCRDTHCRVCGIVHTDGTCAECLAAARADLHEIARLCGSLPEEVAHRGVEGEAMMLLGPSADPEARGHLEASVLAGRVSADYLDRGIRSACGGWGHTDHELHPLFVLGSWDGIWRDALDHDEPEALTLPTAVDYLDRQLAYMGGYEHVPFDDFARDLRRCVAHLEAVLHDGEQIERGAPCPVCDKPLTHVWGPRVVDDKWTCTNRRCDVEGYTTAQYQGWVEEDARNAADKLTAADMAIRFTDEETTLKASVVRVWGARGFVRKRGFDGNGMTLYDVGDVEARLADEPKSA